MVIEQSRKVLGKSSSGKSHLTIALPKTDFGPGESIEGVITLMLGKPTNSKGLSVELTSSEKRQARRYVKGKQKTVTENYKKVWQNIRLDSEKEYPADQLMEYPFKMTAPSLTAGYDPLSQLVKWVIKDKSPPGDRYKQFMIDAKLDISLGFDVNDKIAVSVRLNPN